MASSEGNNYTTTNNNITIEGIFTCSDASKEMISLQTAKLLKGIGLEGDRYAKGIGTYSTLQEPGRQLTLISIDGVEDALNSTTADITLLPSSLSSSSENYNDIDSDPSKSSSSNTISMRTLRRNIALRGISSQDLLKSIGSIIQIGSTAKVYVHRNCVPCMYNERKNQCNGLMDVLWDNGGVSCEVIETGIINIDDQVTIISVDEFLQQQQQQEENTTTVSVPNCPNDGGKLNEFFIRPKQRSADMVRTLLEGKKKLKEKLSKTDREGLLRLQKSYESVGLQF